MTDEISALTKRIRRSILVATTEAGTGHPTSSLSGVDLMSVLLFCGFFKADLKEPNFHNNDRLIFSKGHAAPLFYALYEAAGVLSLEELKELRKFGSPLEGHPTMAFPYTEAATGSLGQGLSIGVGMALAGKQDNLSYRTYALLGDSEMAEGQVWEAIQLAGYYGLNNLIGIIDVNRLGQRGETMYGHNTKVFENAISAFGWETIVIDGHSLAEITQAYEKALASKEKPVMIIAKTFKGKGVEFFEDKDNWHGKPLPKEELEKALEEIGEESAEGEVAQPEKLVGPSPTIQSFDTIPDYDTAKPVAVRKAYGNALARVGATNTTVVALDAEVSNSTYADAFKTEFPDRFYETFIAEQNMVSVAVGMARRGKIPFVSSFAAFLTRAHDQIRMAQYSDSHIIFVGSHAGVSIGEDGSSQMGLEDLAMFRSILGSTVFYPADAVATEKLVEEAVGASGIVYLRTTRAETPIIYKASEDFPVGGSKSVKSSSTDTITVVAAGITLHEALTAYETLKKDGITIRVIDAYSVKPIDERALKKAASETRAILTVEDHFPEGGLGEAVLDALRETNTPVYSLAVREMPRSGKPQQLLDYEKISSSSIVEKVKEIYATRQS